MRPPQGGLLLSAALLALAALILVGATVTDVIGRATGPEAVPRRYFSALEALDVDSALAAIVPSERARWTSFVENGAGNTYWIVGVSVRHPSIMDRLFGGTADPQDVTIFLDITQAADGARWQATPRVPLVRHDGRWYLAHPPLAPI